VGIAASAAAQSEQPIVIENSELRVALSPRNATLLSVSQKPSGAACLGSVKQAGWFRVQIPLPYWEGNAAASQDVKALTVKRLAGDSVELEADQLLSKGGSFPVSFHLTLRLEHDNLVSKLSVQNHGKETIDRVQFPIVDVPPAADSSELLLSPIGPVPLRFAFSANDVRTDHNPFDSLDPLDLGAWIFSDPKVSVKVSDYPMYLPTGWLKFVGEGRGVGLDVHGLDFQFQKFMLERRLYRDAVSREANRRDYELSVNWYPLVRPNDTWESPEVYLKFDGTDWHPIALQHRDWIKTRVHRADVAPELRSCIGWLSRPITNYDQIPAIAKQGVEVGAPYFIVYGWSQISAAGMSYSAYPRTDIGGIESLQRNLLKARELGSHPLAWYNGTLSVERNLDHMTQGKDWVTLDRWKGAIPGGQWSLFEPFQVATHPNNDTWLENDPSSGVKDFMLSTVRRFVEDYHFSGYEMDQAYKYFLSYRDVHQGGQPAFRYSQGYADYFTRAQELVKKNDPNGIIVGEGFSDFLDQYVDSSWVFEGGPLNVPQQSMLRYSLPWVNVPVRAMVKDRGHANQAFMMNSPLDIFDDLADYPDYAQHLRGLHALKKKTWQYFYQGEFSDAEGFSFPDSPASGVMAKSYTDPAGNFFVVVVINPSGTALEATLRPDAVYASRKIQHYYLDGRTEAQAPSPEVRLQLPAFDIQVLAYELP
jgi:hypothetical protein